MASSLPDNPSLSRLRVVARDLQRQATAGDPNALALIRAHHPRPDSAIVDRPVALHVA